MMILNPINNYIIYKSNSSLPTAQYWLVPGMESSFIK